MEQTLTTASLEQMVASTMDKKLSLVIWGGIFLILFVVLLLNLSNKKIRITGFILVGIATLYWVGELIALILYHTSV